LRDNIEDLRIVLQVDKLKEKLKDIGTWRICFLMIFFPFVYTGEKIKKEYEIGDCRDAVKLNQIKY
jgi:hypothetical protein